MKFHRRLKPFQAISFDLDDTLYNNEPVMQATYEKMCRYFSQVLSQFNNHHYDHHFWSTFRNQALKIQPDLQHDVGQLRLQSYYLGLKSLGFSEDKSLVMANEALNYFVEQRSDFSVPDEVHQLLSELKKRWPLLAISNGNVDTKAIELDGYFSHIYHAGNNGLKQKPSRDMFNTACQQLSLQPKQLLHVGDCGRNDVYGAVKSGCQAVWLSCYQVGKPLSVLPTIELSNICELQGLL